MGSRLRGFAHCLLEPGLLRVLSQAEAVMEVTGQDVVGLGGGRASGGRWWGGREQLGGSVLTEARMSVPQTMVGIMGVEKPLCRQLGDHLDVGQG